MLRKHDQYLAQLNSAETGGSQNVQAPLVDYVDQAWLQGCILSGSIKRLNKHRSRIEELKDIDVGDLYIRPLATGATPRG